LADDFLLERSYKAILHNRGKIEIALVMSMAWLALSETVVYKLFY